MSRNSALSLAAACALAMIFTIVAASTYVIRLYPTIAVVTGFDLGADAVIFTDRNNVQWWLGGGIDDWCVGDDAALIIDSNGTEDIYDDLIVTARYGG